MNVLVTGAAGFIGRSLVVMLAKAGYRVVALDSYRFSNADQIVAHPKIKWETGDTRNEELMNELVSRADKVIHLAAPSSFLMHEENDIEATSFTVDGFKTMIEAVRKTNRIKKVVFASTSAVYEKWNEFPRVPFHEALDLNPPDSKAGWKHACELEAERYSNRYGITVISMRPFSVYGVGEHTKHGYANITSLFVWAMMTHHRPIIWGDGTQTRDFVYVEDVARAFKLALENDDLPTTAFNVAFGKDYSFNEAAQIIGEELGVEPNPIHVDIPIQIYARRLLADTAKAEQVLGFKAEIAFRDGVRRVIEAARNLPPDIWQKLKLETSQKYYQDLPKKEFLPETVHTKVTA